MPAKAVRHENEYLVEVASAGSIQLVAALATQIVRSVLAGWRDPFCGGSLAVPQQCVSAGQIGSFNSLHATFCELSVGPAAAAVTPPPPILDASGTGHGGLAHETLSPAPVTSASPAVGAPVVDDSNALAESTKRAI